MLDLKTWLGEQGLTVRAFALDFGAPLKTVEDWVYRGKVPSQKYEERITNYILNHCAHHWIIAVPEGPQSEGICRRCDELKWFENSASEYHLSNTGNRARTTFNSHM